MQTGERGQPIAIEPGSAGREIGRAAEVEDTLLQNESATANRATQLPTLHRPVLDLIRQKHEEALLVILRAAEVVGELDEHF
jgi:hypothetical protein